MSRRPNFKIILVTGLAVIVASAVNHKAVPVYDGVGFPDEPYRYVVPPASQKPAAPPPTQAIAQVTPGEINNNVNGVYVTSQENGPQVAISLSQNSLEIPPKTKTITIEADPLAPTIQPKDGKIAGNVYRLKITGDAGAINFALSTNNNYKYIDLRLPQGFPSGQVIEFRPFNGSWARVQTSQVGTDIYETNLQATGDFAMVVPSMTSSQTVLKNHKKVLGLLITLVGILGMAAVIFVVRRNSRVKGRR